MLAGCELACPARVDAATLAGMILQQDAHSAAGFCSMLHAMYLLGGQFAIVQHCELVSGWYHRSKYIWPPQAATADRLRKQQQQQPAWLRAG